MLDFFGAIKADSGGLDSGVYGEYIDLHVALYCAVTCRPVTGFMRQQYRSVYRRQTNVILGCRRPVGCLSPHTRALTFDRLIILLQENVGGLNVLAKPFTIGFHHD